MCIVVVHVNFFTYKFVLFNNTITASSSQSSSVAGA